MLVDAVFVVAVLSLKISLHHVTEVASVLQSRCLVGEQDFDDSASLLIVFMVLHFGLFVSEVILCGN